MSDMLAVKLTGVTKTYRLYSSAAEQALDVLGLGWLHFWRKARYSTYPALRELSLEVGRGERLGILGRNGAGKTTLLKLITGNFAPTSGSVAISGTVQALMSVGLGFHPDFTGSQNARSALAYNGLGRRDLERALEDVVDFVELGEFLHQPMKTYSLGMQARLMFAVATAVKPDILIVDEVLSAGDAYFAAKSADRMRRLAFSGCTLLLVSHALQQILQFCDRAIWLEAGRVLMHGSAREVVGAYEVASAQRIQSALPGSSSGQAGVDQNGEQFRNRPWLASQIDERERALDPVEITAFEVSLRDGRRVMRWPSAPGMKIESLRLARDDRTTCVFECGGPLEIEMEVRSESRGEMSCRYYFSFFGVDGRRAAWVTSSVDRFSAEEGQVRKVRVRLAPLLLGRGSYILSTSIFDGTDPSEIGRAKRYDLLARCLEFTVVDGDARDPATFYHPAEWSFAATPKRTNDSQIVSI